MMFRWCIAAFMLLGAARPGHARASEEVTHPFAEYPASAVDAREQGATSIKAFVDTRGRTTSATIVHTSICAGCRWNPGEDATNTVSYRIKVLRSGSFRGTQ